MTVQVAVLPDPSVAVSVIVVVPSPSVAPAAGDCVMSGELVQLSVAVTELVRSGALPWQLPSAEMLAGVEAHTVMVGAESSTTVWFTVHVAVLPDPSVAVNVIVVVPRPSVAPAAGDCVMSGEPVQLSVAVTDPVRSGAEAVQLPLAVRFAGVEAHTVMLGAESSTTV